MNSASTGSESYWFRPLLVFLGYLWKTSVDTNVAVTITIAVTVTVTIASVALVVMVRLLVTPGSFATGTPLSVLTRELNIHVA